MGEELSPKTFDAIHPDDFGQWEGYNCYNQAARHSAQEIHKVFNVIFKKYRPDPVLRTYLKREYALTDEAINRYILSPPPGNTAQQLLQQGFYHDDLIGVPGFYKTENGEVRFRQYYSTDFGIAVRSESGKIIGIFFHFTSQGGRTKTQYGWLSTRLQQMGTPSGAPIGWIGKAGQYMIYDELLGKRRPALPMELDKRGSLFIADSSFKAAACHHHYDARVLFASGYRNISSMSNAVRNHAERIGSPLRVVLTPDAYWRNNVNLMAVYLRVIDGIYRDCYPIWIAIWPPELGKQIDQVIRGGHADHIKPKRISKVFLPYICKWAETETEKGTEGAADLHDLAVMVRGKIVD